MQDYQEAMVKSLVAVAWADGQMDDDETEVIEALLSAFELEPADADTIRDFAKTHRSLDDVPLTELSAHDRRMLVQHAVILTFVDGEQSDQERAVIGALVEKLRIPSDEAAELLSSATERAERLVALL
jgi:tellurite resistance protein